MGELVEVVAVGLYLYNIYIYIYKAPITILINILLINHTEAWFSSGGVPAIAAEGLCEQCPPHVAASELVCSYQDLKWPAVLLPTLHLGFTNI